MLLIVVSIKLVMIMTMVVIMMIPRRSNKTYDMMIYGDGATYGDGGDGAA